MGGKGGAVEAWVTEMAARAQAGDPAVAAVVGGLVVAGAVGLLMVLMGRQRHKG